MGINCDVTFCKTNENGKCSDENVLACYLKSRHPTRVDKEDEYLFQKNKMSELELMKHQRDLLATCLWEVLIHDKILNENVEPNGPQLVLATEEYCGKEIEVRWGLEER